MTQRNRSLFYTLIFTATLACGLVAMPRHASAALSSCGIRSGTMRFWDRETNRCGYVSGDNQAWSAFGWNNRADEFGNDGNTHSVCIYQEFDKRGTAYRLPRGYAMTWRNIVSSNAWTTASSCPR